MHKLLSDRIYGLPLPIYLCLSLLVYACMQLGILPSGMAGVLLVLVVLGGLFHWIGSTLPIVRSYLGGGTVACLFLASLLTYAGGIPQEVQGSISAFLNENGFLNLFIAALIAGSILSMDREVLSHSAVRFLPVAFLAMAVGIGAVVGAGLLLGVSPKETVFYIAIPMMSGGMGAGVVPLSQMYAAAQGTDPTAVMSQLIPASTVGNVAAILMAGLLGKLGEAVPGLSGNGQLMPVRADAKKKEHPPLSYSYLSLGVVVSLAATLAGEVLHALVPAVHAYAWMILVTALAVGCNLVPESVAEGCRQWSDFMIHVFTHGLLVGIGITILDLDAVLATLTPTWLLLIAVVTVAVTAGAALGGRLVGFYPIEAGITAGLCTINMGGSGNLAILSASKRMGLLAFAQLATRICGSMTLLLTSFLLSVCFP